VKEGTTMDPPEVILSLSTAFVFRESPPEVDDNPEPRAPVNVSVGAEGFPAGN